MAMVLLVDDDQLLLDVLKMLLQAEGYDVITANDGPKALSLVKAVTPDLVISDIRMSPMSGIELLRNIRREHAALPVIMLTAYASSKTANEASQLGAFAYLSKPFSNEEVIDTVRKAVVSGKNNGPGTGDTKT